MLPPCLQHPWTLPQNSGVLKVVSARRLLQGTRDQCVRQFYLDKHGNEKVERKAADNGSRCKDEAQNLEALRGEVKRHTEEVLYNCHNYRALLSYVCGRD